VSRHQQGARRDWTLFLTRGHEVSKHDGSTAKIREVG
jgi:hypothetical protein